MDEVERTHEAIEELVERRRRRNGERAVSELDEEEDRLLSNLLSQLSALKAAAAAADRRGTDEVAAELRKLSRQNTITHCLLSVMIVVTTAWQLSEASLLLSLKSRLVNPFRSVGNLIGRVLKGGGNLQELQMEVSSSTSPQLTMPELPVISLPSLPREQP